MSARFVGPLLLLALVFVCVGQEQPQLASISPVQAPQGTPKTSFIVLEDPRAGGFIDRTKITNCIRLTVHELHVENNDLPRIIVFHLSAEAADYLGVLSGSAWRTKGNGQYRYEIWVVGQPSNLVYSQVMENLLQEHFRIFMSKEHRDKTVENIEQHLNSTVNVKELP